MRKKIILAVTAVFAFLVLTACAGPNEAVNTVAAGGEIDGFWKGIWHGMIIPITFVGSLFWDDVNIYEVHNNGNWYDFGFMLGTGLLGGSFFRGLRR